MRDDFAVFILTHGRPRKQRSLNTLLRDGYTGRYYLVVDNLDTTLFEYQQLYGDKVLVFDKNEYVQKTETALSPPLTKFVVFARNAAEDFARELNCKFFGLFDDDLIHFRHRYLDNGRLKSAEICNADEVIESILEYMEQASISTTSFGIASQYIGGSLNKRIYTPNDPYLRMCFNAYFRNAKFEVNWQPNIQEDRITSIYYGRAGQIWLQLLQIELDSAPLYGKTSGGSSDVYNSVSRFLPVFFSTVYFPDTHVVNCYHGQFTPKINKRDYICGKIVSDRYKKDANI